MIINLEDELDSKIEDVGKLKNAKKQLGGYLAISIFIITLCVCGISFYIKFI